MTTALLLLHTQIWNFTFGCVVSSGSTAIGMPKFANASAIFTSAAAVDQQTDEDEHDEPDKAKDHNQLIVTW